jgi:hypothetical protein
MALEQCNAAVADTMADELNIKERAITRKRVADKCAVVDVVRP